MIAAPTITENPPAVRYTVANSPHSMACCASPANPAKISWGILTFSEMDGAHGSEARNNS